MSLTRRTFLSGTCACGFSLGHGALEAAPAGFSGCAISPAVYRQFNDDKPTFSSVADGLFARNRHFRSTGNATLDQDLDRALVIVADLFKVRPAFGFYDPEKFKLDKANPDTWLMNAWASPLSTNIPGTWGTIGFGRDLFKHEFELDDSGTTIMTIVAHEFAHNWQQKSGHIDAMNSGAPSKVEINADFLAGYYLGTRKTANLSRKFRKAGELFERLGKFSEGNPDRTHGNSEERLSAAEAGFRIAYVEKRDFNYATKAGLKYVGL